ncbi:hypothetical protein A2715_05255 [Candidatus Woesebacteria bacterium RIFCSPHIGHO2_01_FULL_39_32]|uniref:Penicillin-binding protein transpeptidase domain-containing protein n=1 Tax=Candidatus Woesebacteria bacterium RIFCSPLOWO2_01_FULL_39_25 TaxID=1802521 RepID=A0A1F8BLL0_9BACT|nr:MAG: hypothetical protein A2715_05255 [Candidatus Woesebacteria bacterium RIFCSPHIGHO2_01_FULL_39_32]OGM38531.1 MAG: hypothetical protein A3F01_04215 [Candidatus Woesebacteria bacterium RIFCSPHIGHO2_12_FULL_38_11]OGM64957.1 MAG: hypothetical protein A2893_04865 [Candidatus Woesebacteria bacterium RIFCSPLOWO2_01_FULL_39_25]
MLIRLRLISIFFAFAYLVLVVRLFYWQIYKGKELSVEARGQYQAQWSIDAPRGDILSSDGSWLAASADSWLIYASLPDIKEPSKKISEQLAPLLVEDPEDKDALFTEIDRIYSLLTRDNVEWIPIKSKVTPEVKKHIEKLEISGIGYELQEARIYPEASTAAQLMGFVGKDEAGGDIGYFGLEGYYDVVLSGKPGFKARERDASGIPILLGTTREISAIKGVDLQTNIDKFIQLTLDKKLKEGIERYGASAGVAVVMNPKNGAILGMGAYPSYDPSEYWEFGDELFNNPVISNSFEPGSVFKVIVMASALDAGVVKPDTICNICGGAVKVDKYTIETWNQQYYPNSTLTDVIVHSDNVGMVFTSRRIGADILFDYLENFGIGKPTGIDLQGEANPGLRDKGKWSSVDLATAGFGQGVAVTPIQLLTAVSVIANKGVKVTPQVVDKLVGDGWEEDIKPVIGKRVISQRSAEQITTMMVEAAKNGESKWTHARGFRVAGKTGTAQIPIEGHYDEDKTIASFVGFAPYDNPKFLMLVTLRQPTTSPWASETAAPLWYSIAKDFFEYFQIQPEK